jgi:sodium-independent sulfate anion transporter 11
MECGEVDWIKLTQIKSLLQINFSGIMVILALSLLTPYFYFIPKATLSSVIICAVLFMVEVGMVKPMWKSNSKYPFTRC